MLGGERKVLSEEEPSLGRLQSFLGEHRWRADDASTHTYTLVSVVSNSNNRG